MTSRSGRELSFSINRIRYIPDPRYPVDTVRVHFRLSFDRGFVRRCDLHVPHGLGSEFEAEAAAAIAADQPLCRALGVYY